MNKTGRTGSLAVWQDKIVDYIILHAGALISALIVVVVGFIVARWIGKLLNRGLERKAMEPPMRKLVVRIMRLLVFALALVVALDTAGVKMTALIAGVQGQVTSIELFTTTLLHADHSQVIIPNRKIVSEILHNYGHIRQLNLNVGVSYGTNINTAVTIVRDVLSRNARVLKEPTPGVGITMLADSSINIAVCPWTAVADYGPAQTEIYQAIVEQFRANNIQISFPQREVRTLNNPV